MKYPSPNKQRGSGIIMTIIIIVVILVVLKYYLGFNLDKVGNEAARVWTVYILPTARFVWNLLDVYFIQPIVAATKSFSH